MNHSFIYIVLILAFNLGMGGCDAGEFYIEPLGRDAMIDLQADQSQDTIDTVEEELPPNQDYCGDIKPGFYPIINGVTEPDPSVVSLTEGQKAAIGLILIDSAEGTSMCTATVIAPNVVLSAAHCFEHSSISSVQFLGGEDVSSPAFFLDATHAHVHPSYGTTYDSPPRYDVSVIILGGDTASAGITPIPVNCTTTSIIGQRVQAVGYGITDIYDRSNSRRWWTVLTCDDESSFYYGVHGYGTTGTCFGDSGGPLLYTKPDGRVYVMGDLSVGDSGDCLGHDYYPRTDDHCGFIREYVPADPCEGETLQGRCSGSTAVWCEAESVRTEDCSLSDQVCGLNGEGNYRCVSPDDPCSGETFEGRCEGNTAIWCEGGEVRTMTCSEGTICGNPGDGLYRCVDECMLIGMTGRCDELNFARWCEDGVMKARDCTICDQVCGWMSEAMGYYCL